ncbi:RTX toxin acyltransferase [Pantoea sp. RIT-PI-b]|uniref:toxin-activating lysine-acyltransferase n=1 Tax=Pantoea sp. RIT-PI-b TaxID=1681195 RepID=UPI000676852C|nr:toxin-activating lysine-acyltransferase [Pantoea sp. RIT-PI-b]KNC17585.1 RTX toxin acyltransferase [Pantoea sp. RIT-PI-b]
MEINGYRLIAPWLAADDTSEAEVLGMAVWLWMHSKRHRDAPLHTLPTLLLPPIKQQQYAIAVKEGRPQFYLGWAWLDEEAERRYLTHASVMMQEQDWISGDRLWITDFIAPFGEIRDLLRLMCEVILPEQCFRWQDQQGNLRGQRVHFYHGKKVSESAAKQWQQAHPLSMALPEIG